MLTFYEETSWIRKLKPGFNGTYGLEIETESLVPYMMEKRGVDGADQTYNFYSPNDLKFWKITEDHSLRNFGFEYILTKPLELDKVYDALNEFEEKTKTLGIEFIQDKQSTSVHVHVNMRDETFLTLANFVTLFTLFENPLINFCGERRKSNFFCMSNRYAEGLCRRVTEFFTAVSKGDPSCLQNLSEEDQKYSSLNLVPLHKLGSVEVRTMRGVTDVAVISNWVGMLNSLLLFARQELTPLDIIGEWRQNEMEFFEAVFGEYSQYLRDPQTRESIERSLWYAGSIAASCDWNHIVGTLKAEGDRREELRKAQKDNLKKLVKPMKIPAGAVIAHNDWVLQENVFNPLPVIDDVEEIPY